MTVQRYELLGKSRMSGSAEGLGDSCPRGTQPPCAVVAPLALGLGSVAHRPNSFARVGSNRAVGVEPPEQCNPRGTVTADVLGQAQLSLPQISAGIFVGLLLTSCFSLHVCRELLYFRHNKPGQILTHLVCL